MRMTSYTELIRPINLFENSKEVREFVKIDPDLIGLEAMLILCEQDELYEWCEIIYKEVCLLKRNQEPVQGVTKKN